MRTIPPQQDPDQLWYSKCGIYFNPYAEYKLIHVYRDTPMHTHMDFYEVTFVTKGSFVVSYNGEEKCYEKNSLLFWKCGETHAIYLARPQSTHYSFLIPEKAFEAFCAQHHPGATVLTNTPFAEHYLSPEKSSYLATLAATALTCMQDPHEHFQLFLQIVLFHMFFDESGTLLAKNRYLDNYVTDLIFKFETQDCLAIPISDIYNMYPVWNGALIKHFKMRTGITIVEYRNTKRMEYAATLLCVHKLPVTQVATQVGITSLSYFSKKFVEFFGVLPSEYSEKYY